jgi:hypothetical protein
MEFFSGSSHERAWEEETSIRMRHWWSLPRNTPGLHTCIAFAFEDRRVSSMYELPSFLSTSSGLVVSYESKHLFLTDLSLRRLECRSSYCPLSTSEAP